MCIINNSQVVIHYYPLNFKMNKNLVDLCLRINTLNFIRLYSRAQSIKRMKNPGVQKRINVLSERNVNNLEDVDVEELDNELMNPMKLQRKYMKEIDKIKEKEHLYLVRDKYFKEKNINFLTLNDKEQIKYLHNKNPNEWTIEKLSESFPALPQTVWKVIKSQWSPRSENRKLKHDKAVENNWKLLNEGKLPELPENLVNHLKKFSNRKQSVIETNKIMIAPENTVRRDSEFASIITNYEKLCNKTEVQVDNTTVSIDKSARTSEVKSSYTENQKEYSPVTLSRLKEDIIRDINSGKSVDEYDKMLISVRKEDVSQENSVKCKTDDHNKLTEALKFEKKPVEYTKYPERIEIPKSKHKKGCVYKLNDCYYDDHGEFLYRVPGMQ